MADTQAGSRPGVDIESAGDQTFRLLVAATEAAVADDLTERIEERVEGRRAEVRIVAPALTGSPLKHAFGDVDEAISSAERRLDESLRRLSERGLEASGAIGDADPMLAIEDALREFPADEIMIVTRVEDQARWLEGDLFERAKRRFEPPIVHVALARRDSAGPRVAGIERAGRGTEVPPEAELSGRSRNMPPLSVRQLAGIGVALVGTIVLVVLAATCSGPEVGGSSSDTGGSDNACVIRYIIAGAVALVNVAHVVGLVLFQSVRYRGVWARLFAELSLYGTPAAVLASLLIH